MFSQAPLLQVAPMLHVTDRHFRFMMRLLTYRTQLWTEMIVDATLTHTKDLYRHLGHPGDPLSALDPCSASTSEGLNFVGASSMLGSSYPWKEAPIVCQLGGSNPQTMKIAAQIVKDFGGYDEININCGCPSQRVGVGQFGMKLMENVQGLNEIITQLQTVWDSKPEHETCQLPAKRRLAHESICEVWGPKRRSPRCPGSQSGSESSVTGGDAGAEEEGYPADSVHGGRRESPRDTGNGAECDAGALHESDEKGARREFCLQNNVSVKLRIGIGHKTDYSYLDAKLRAISETTGLTKFILHGRNGLTSLNPDKNRKVPKLNYFMVLKAAQKNPQYQITLNGGVQNLKEAKTLLQISDIRQAMLLRVPGTELSEDAGGPSAEDFTELSEGSIRAQGVADTPAADEGKRNVPDGPAPPEDPGSPDDPCSALEEAGSSASTSTSLPKVAWPASINDVSLWSGEVVCEHKPLLNGVMIGRAASNNPVIFAEADTYIYGEKSNPPSSESRFTILSGYCDYLAEIERLEQSLPKAPTPFILMRPLVGLFHGTPGSAIFRQSLDSMNKKRTVCQGHVDRLRAIINLLDGAGENVKGAFHECLWRNET